MTARYVGTIYIQCDDGDEVATVTCRDRKEFREIAEGAAITLDEPVLFADNVALIGYVEWPQ
jgi:hypothetical protein